MSGMTSERLEELRRIAEAATPGPWWVDGWEVRTKDGDHFIASIAPAFQGDHPDASCWELDANIRHIAAFNPTTALALLDEIERLRREWEVLAEALKHVFTCENCECALCPQGTELSYKAYRALGEAIDLLDGEEIVDNVTHFALYHPDLNVWECQACRFQWEFMEDGNPYEHGMRFCPRCGRRIEFVLDGEEWHMGKESISELRNALSSAPANPYAAVVEAVENAIRYCLACGGHGYTVRAFDGSEWDCWYCRTLREALAQLQGRGEEGQE